MADVQKRDYDSSDSQSVTLFGYLQNTDSTDKTVKPILVDSTTGGLILAGYNTSTGSLDTTEVADALLNTSKQTGITQLTAPGDTAEKDVSNFGVYGYVFTVAAIDTTVVVELQGSIDVTNYSTLPLTSTAIPDTAITSNQMTISANGTYIIYTDAPVVDVRLNFVSETGGTAATIDSSFFSRRK